VEIFFITMLIATVVIITWFAAFVVYRLKRSTR